MTNLVTPDMGGNKFGLPDQAMPGAGFNGLYPGVGNTADTYDLQSLLGMGGLLTGNLSRGQRQQADNYSVGSFNNYDGRQNRRNNNYGAKQYNQKQNNFGGR